MARRFLLSFLFLGLLCLPTVVLSGPKDIPEELPTLCFQVYHLPTTTPPRETLTHRFPERLRVRALHVQSDRPVQIRFLDGDPNTHPIPVGPGMPLEIRDMSARIDGVEVTNLSRRRPAAVHFSFYGVVE